MMNHRQLAVIFAFCVSVAIADDSALRDEEKARRAVQLIDQTNDLQKRHPDELDVLLKSDDGNDVRLRLRRTESPELLTADENGNVQEVVSRDLENDAFYEVRGARGLVMSRSVEQAPGIFKRSLSGSFSHEGMAYALESPSSTELEKRGLTDENTHFVVKRFALKDTEKGEREKRSRRKKQYGVEVYLVIDQTVYNDYASRNSGTAMSEIRKYYAHIMSGVDMRYGNLEESDFSITVKTKGIFICQSGRQCVNNGREGTTVQTTAFLRDLKTWDQDASRRFLQRSDHVMVFTKQNLWSVNTEGESSDAPIGVANTKAMCGTSSYSICEDMGTYKSEGTATHELGHGLGARYHDGSQGENGDQGATSCPEDSSYIMAPSNSVSKWNALNPYRFSSCSVRQIRGYLTSNDDCLMNAASDLPGWQRPAHEMPGQMIDANEQCEKEFGANFEADVTDFAEICAEMICKWERRVGNQILTTTNRMPPLRGTSCGNRKWCQMAECVSDRNAPEMDLTCPHGDRRINGEDCATHLNGAPYKCYESEVNEKCCASCNQMKNVNSRNGCEWGDRHARCASISVSDCSKPANFFDCSCDRCSNADLPSSSCEDYTGTLDGYTCSQLVGHDKGECRKEQILNLCCGSCRPHLNVNNPGCMLGDSTTAQWRNSAGALIGCPEIRQNPSMCNSNPLIKIECCESCS